MIARRESQPHEELNYLYSEAIIGVGYSFLLRAEETPGNLSIYSDSLAYTLLPSIGTNRMSPNGMTELLSPGRSLTWAFFPQIKMEDYCLTILNQFDEFIFRIILHPTDYVAGSDSYNILEDVILHPNGLYKWRIDMGAKYVNNKETVGSESGWAYFLIPSDPSIK